MIPRVIHRIWVGGPMPEQFVSYGRTWADHHPGWEMRLWGDGDLPPLRNQGLYDRAAEMTPAANVGQFRADLLRYELLWQFGGVYVDADTECLRPVDPLIEGLECFAAWETQNRWVGNTYLGSVPEHPFVGRIIDGLPRSVMSKRRYTPNFSTGPRYLTRLHRRSPSEMTVLPSHLFYPYGFADLGTAKAEPPWPDGCYAVHHWANRRRMREEAAVR